MSSKNIMLFSLMVVFSGAMGAQADTLTEQLSPHTNAIFPNLEASPYPAVRQSWRKYRQGLEPFSHVLKTENHCLINDLETNSPKLTPNQKICMIHQIERNFDELIKLALSIDDSTEVLNLKKQKYETLARLMAL